MTPCPDCPRPDHCAKHGCFCADRAPVPKWWRWTGRVGAVLAVSALVLGPAWCSRPRAAEIASPNVQPPEEYRGERAFFNVTLRPEQLEAKCREFWTRRGEILPRRYHPVSCADPVLGIIYELNPCLPAPGWSKRFPSNALRCHELGHLNGWAADHPVRTRGDQ